MTVRQTSFEAEVLQRIIRPEQGLSPEAARGFLGPSFAHDDLARMRDLAQKARAGALSDEEQQHAESCERLGSLLGLLQSKARRALAA